jgi:hypothetical protein
MASGFMVAWWEVCGAGASGPMVGRDRELARVMLLLDDALAGGGRLVPGRVAEATAHRLAQLSDPARALVRTAAVAGV